MILGATGARIAVHSRSPAGDTDSEKREHIGDRSHCTYVE